MNDKRLDCWLLQELFDQGDVCLQDGSVVCLKKVISTVQDGNSLTLLHSERPKLYAILAFLSAIGLYLSCSPRSGKLHTQKIMLSVLIMILKRICLNIHLK